MRRGLYAIIDIVANDITGPIILHRHEAAAIRFFNDVAVAPNSQVGAHPHDYELRRLGWLHEDQDNNTRLLEAEDMLILAGGKWAALNNRDKPTGETNQ